jgi:hypothetical protein
MVRPLSWLPDRLLAPRSGNPFALWSQFIALAARVENDSKGLAGGFWRWPAPDKRTPARTSVARPTPAAWLAAAR